MQLTSGIVTESAAMPSCAPAVVYCSYDSASPSTIITPPSSMEKQQRPDAFSADDCVRHAAADHILEYSISSSSTVSTSDALQVAREHLRKIYIAEASILRNMEECSSSSDLDSLVDALRQLRNFESDVQRRLFSHLRLLQP